MKILYSTAYAAGVEHPATYGVLVAEIRGHVRTRVTAGLFVPALAERVQALGGRWRWGDDMPNGWEWEPEDGPAPAPEDLDRLVRKACLEMGPPFGDLDRFARQRVRLGSLVTGEATEHGPSEALVEATRDLFGNPERG